MWLRVHDNRSPRKKAKCDSVLSSKVEGLSAELAEMKSLLHAHPSDAVSEEVEVSLPSMPVLTRENDFFRDYVGAEPRMPSDYTAPDRLSEGHRCDIVGCLKKPFSA